MWCDLLHIAGNHRLQSSSSVITATILTFSPKLLLRSGYRDIPRDRAVVTFFLGDDEF